MGRAPSTRRSTPFRASLRMTALGVRLTRTMFSLLVVKSHSASLNLAPRREISLRVVKNDAEREALAGEDWADAVLELGAREAARAVGRSIACGDDHGLALLQANGVAHRLGSRPLLDQQQLPAGEFLVPPRQAKDHLKRKDDLAVDILVEAVVVAGDIAQQQRRGSFLAMSVAALQKSVEI